MVLLMVGGNGRKRVRGDVDDGELENDGGEDEVEEKPQPKKGAMKGVQEAGHTGCTYRPKKSEEIVHFPAIGATMELAVGTSSWPTRRVNDARRCHYALTITDVEGTRVGSFMKPGDWCRFMVLLSHSLSNRRLAFTVQR